MTDARDLLKQARRREATYRLCLRADLAAEFEDLEQQLEPLVTQGGWTSSSLAPDSDVARITERMETLRAEMAEHTATLRFRALKRRDWEDLIEAHPGREGKDERYNFDTFPVALVAACLVDPEMTPAEVEDLFDVVNEGERDALFGAAWSVNQDVTVIPFSERASVVNRWRAENSKQPAPGASLAASS